MKFKFIEQEETYDGSQLSSQNNYSRYGLLGDSIISWIGPCDIPEDKIVDVEDILQKQKIYSQKMLHFIIEVFEIKLFAAASLQRIFCDLIKEEIYKLSQGKVLLSRQGDDLYLLEQNKESGQTPIKNEDAKLNISIATVSPVSALLHIGINIDSRNTPVKTCSLNYFGIEPQKFAQNLMQAWANEYASIRKATQKVHWVK